MIDDNPVMGVILLICMVSFFWFLAGIAIGKYLL